MYIVEMRRRCAATRPIFSNASEVWHRQSDRDSVFRLVKLLTSNPYMFRHQKEPQYSAGEDLDPEKDFYPKRPAADMTKTVTDLFVFDLDQGSDFVKEIAQQLFERFCAGHLYSKLDINKRHMLSMNPFNRPFSIYGNKFVAKYWDAAMGGKSYALPPHIFDVAAQSMNADIDTGIVCLGGPGSGKPENFLRVLEFMDCFTGEGASRGLNDLVAEDRAYAKVGGSF